MALSSWATFPAPKEAEPIQGHTIGVSSEQKHAGEKRKRFSEELSLSSVQLQPHECIEFGKRCKLFLDEGRRRRLEQLVSRGMCLQLCGLESYTNTFLDCVTFAQGFDTRLVRYTLESKENTLLLAKRLRTGVEGGGELEADSS
jgi:hypothetical protein